MAASPRYKVFDAAGKYQASCHERAAAACLASFYGEGAEVRVGHAKRETVWTEGKDGNGIDSYDVAEETMVKNETARK